MLLFKERFVFDGFKDTEFTGMLRYFGNYDFVMHTKKPKTTD